MVNGLPNALRFRNGTYGHRDLDRRVASVLHQARWRHGWSVRVAGERLGLSFSYISMLENAQRVPSVVVAEWLIAGYHLAPTEAELLRSVSLRGVGKDFPKPSLYGPWTDS
jgi:transcriptional regulator with XRE-family HTH domain